MSSSQRKASARLKQALEEENYNFISNEVLSSIIEFNKTTHEEILQEFKNNNEKIVKCLFDGFKSITEAITKSSESTTLTSKELCSKIDKLCNSMKSQNIDTQPKSLQDLYDKELLERRNKYYQAHRSEELLTYYKTLLAQDDIFIPPKLRPKVNKSTPNYEIEIQNEFAIQNVQRECNLLEHRLKEMKSTISDLDKIVQSKIDDSFLSTEQKEKAREGYQNRCNEEESKSKEIWKTNFDKLKISHDTAKASENQHFLKIVDESENISTRNNYRGGHQKNYQRQTLNTDGHKISTLSLFGTYSIT